MRNRSRLTSSVCDRHFMAISYHQSPDLTKTAQKGRFRVRFAFAYLSPGSAHESFARGAGMRRHRRKRATRGGIEAHGSARPQRPGSNWVRLGGGRGPTHKPGSERPCSPQDRAAHGKCALRADTWGLASPCVASVVTHEEGRGSAGAVERAHVCGGSGERAVAGVLATDGPFAPGVVDARHDRIAAHCLLAHCACGAAGEGLSVHTERASAAGAPAAAASTPAVHSAARSPAAAATGAPAAASTGVAACIAARASTGLAACASAGVAACTAARASTGVAACIAARASSGVAACTAARASAGLAAGAAARAPAGVAACTAARAARGAAKRASARGAVAVARPAATPGAGCAAAIVSAGGVVAGNLVRCFNRGSGVHRVRPHIGTRVKRSLGARGSCHEHDGCQGGEIRLHESAGTVAPRPCYGSRWRQGAKRVAVFC